METHFGKYTSSRSIGSLGTIHKGRPLRREGGSGVLEKQKNADMGEGGVLPFWTSFFKMSDLAFSGPRLVPIRDPHSTVLWFTVGLLRVLLHLSAATWDLLDLLGRLPPCDCSRQMRLFFSGAHNSFYRLRSKMHTK